MPGEGEDVYLTVRSSSTPAPLLLAVTDPRELTIARSSFC